jgi:Predicted membrane protein (DUF2142)
VRLALASGLVATLVALSVVLTHSPPTLAGTNGVAARAAVAYLGSDQTVCQPGGALPAGTTAIRLSISANAGPSVRVTVLSGQSVITAGRRDAGWGVAETVTVPVARVPRAIPAVRVCATLGAAAEPIQANGELAPGVGGQDAVRLRAEYLRPGPQSWLSLAPTIVAHMSLGHAPSGAWVIYLVIAAMLAAATIAVGVVLGRAGTRAIPRGALACGVVAALSAACWSVITPPFQTPDEPAHFAYVQLLAETGRLPDSSAGGISREEEAALGALHQPSIQWHPEAHTISTQAQQRELIGVLSSRLSRVGPGAAGAAASEPPAFYALETIPYLLGSGGTLLDRLELMRLLSALMAGATALFAFLFVRESLPGAPWAWSVGGLGVALMPLLGFASSAVDPDAMLCAVSAAIFYCLARAFRRGATPRLLIALGALCALGAVTKLNFIGLAPGVGLGLIVLAGRAVRRRSSGEQPGAGASRRELGALAAAVALAASPALVYVASNLLAHHHTLGIASSAIDGLHGHSLPDTISYMWQFYLPRLPGMHDYFPGVSTARQLWFDRAVGLYGWLDTPFPVWAYNLALVPAAAIAVLALRALARRRGALTARLPELLVYVTMGAGLLALIGADSFNARLIEGGSYFQPRYLLPLVPLAGALLALAARGAGRRWGPATGALIVVALLAHDIFSQLQVVARYYG